MTVTFNLELNKSKAFTTEGSVLIRITKDRKSKRIGTGITIPIKSWALKTAATAIVLAHNHPSGNLQASKADEEITQKIKKACEYLDIKVLDHLIIVPEGKYLSFTEEGLL